MIRLSSLVTDIGPSLWKDCRWWMSRRKSFDAAVTRLRPVEAHAMAVDLRSITSAATLPEVTIDADTMAAPVICWGIRNSLARTATIMCAGGG